MSGDTRLRHRIGIDFGNTIGEIDRPQPAKGAINMICHLVFQFGQENVFIVSKAGPIMQEKISKWLMDQSFHTKTGLLAENVIFVRQCEDKARVVQDLQITVFLDDSTKVVRVLAPLPHICRIFWMQHEQHRVSQVLRSTVDKRDRHKVSLNHRGDWNKTMKYFQKIKPAEPDADD